MVRTSGITVAALLAITPTGASIRVASISAATASLAEAFLDSSDCVLNIIISSADFGSAVALLRKNEKRRPLLSFLGMEKARLTYWIIFLGDRDVHVVF